MASHRIRAREPDRVSAPPVARGAEALAAVRRDAAHYPGGHAAGVAHPRSEAEVAAVVRAAPRVLPIGAQSSLTGGATPAGDVVVATDRMDRILALGPGEVTVEPGVPLAVLQAALGGGGAAGDDRDGGGQIEALFAFQRGCELGFAAACGNYRAMFDGGGTGLFERAPPIGEDYPIVLRGSKGEITDREPAELYARACRQGWLNACEAGK